MRKGALYDWLPIVCLFLLTLILTYPVVFHLSDRLIGGGGDSWQFPWNNFVLRQQVLQGKDPYYTDYIFHPVGTSLLQHSYTEFDGFLGILLSPFCNEVAQTNIAMLLASFLSGVGAYLLARDLTQHNIAALFAGIVFAFCPFRMLTMSGHLNFALTQWLPLGLWSFLRLGDQARWRDSLLTGFFVACCYYSNQYYAVYLVIAFILILTYAILRFPHWRTSRLIIQLFVAATFSMLLLAPPLLRFARDYESGVVRTAPSRIAEAERNAAAAREYLNTTRAANNKQTTGWTVLTLAVTGIVFCFRNHVRKTGMLLLIGGVFFLLSLGPRLDLGSFYIPLPYLALMKVPFLYNVRIPWRFSILVILTLSCFAAFGVFFLTSKIKTARFVPPVIFSLLILELAQLPVGMRGFSFPQSFYNISKSSHTAAMLTVPFRLQYSFDSLEIRDQIVHKQKLMMGRISRAPGPQINYFTKIPIAKALRVLSISGQQEIDAVADSKVAPLFRRFFDVRYLTLYPAFSRRRLITDYVRTVFPDAKLLEAQKGFEVYELPPVSMNDFHIDASEEGIRFFLYSGWNIKGRRAKISTVNHEATLILPEILDTTTLKLTLELRGQGLLEVLCDREQIANLPVKQKFQAIVVRIPSKTLERSHQLVTLQSGAPFELKSIGLSALD